MNYYVYKYVDRKILLSCLFTFIVFLEYGCKDNVEEDFSAIVPEVEESKSPVWSSELWEKLQTDPDFLALCRNSDPAQMQLDMDSILKQYPDTLLFKEVYSTYFSAKTDRAVSLSRQLYERYPDYSYLYGDSIIQMNRNWRSTCATRVTIGDIVIYPDYTLFEEWLAVSNKLGALWNQFERSCYDLKVYDSGTQKRLFWNSIYKHAYYYPLNDPTFCQSDWAGIWNYLYTDFRTYRNQIVYYLDKIVYLPIYNESYVQTFRRSVDEANYGFLMMGPERFVRYGNEEYFYLRDIANNTGGSNGSGNPASVPAMVLLKGIFKKEINLPSDIKNRLEQAYEQILADCTFGKIDSIVSKNKVDGTIVYDPTIANGAFTANKDVVLGRDFASTTLGHEWVHIYQDIIAPIWGDKRGMAEFENALFNDIYSFKKHGGILEEDNDVLKKSWIYSILLDGHEVVTVENEYKEMISNLCKNGVPSSVPLSVFNYWAERFGRYDRTYGTDRGYIFNPDVIATYGAERIKSLLSLLDLCF